MMEDLRRDADFIIQKSIEAVLPDVAVEKALQNVTFPGRVYLVAVGKAAWRMAKTASDVLGSKIDLGVCITKYHHVQGVIPHCICYEAGHPVPDENTFSATQAALNLVTELTEDDTVLFLLSGGGSALFEKPLISGEELAGITEQLLACGADIREINTIRKRLSAVKGGRFAKACLPASVYTIVLSDIVGDPIDMIASGPAYPDASTCEEALAVARKYDLHLSEKAMACLQQETPKELSNVTTVVTGSVRELCKAAEAACLDLGYETELLSDSVCCEAKTAGLMLADYATRARGKKAYILGGETVVKLTGHGLGGRNQELALASCMQIAGQNACIFSIGSDGTDGPTDAAGGYVDGDSFGALTRSGISVEQVLADNDSYHALEKIGGLIKTGPTGTNVNDVALALVNASDFAGGQW